MRGYITKRLLIAGVTLVGMSMVIFVLVRLTPGNIADIIFESAGYVDEADRQTGYEDVFSKIAMCRRHYAACGLGEGYVDQFIR